MNTTMQKNEDNILRRVEQIKNYESHQIRLEKINRQNEIKQKKGIIENDYIKMKKQLSKYKNRAGDFHSQKRDHQIKQENMILLSKMKNISTGKQSVYGQHVLRRTTVDPPALNHYKQLLNRPSSERPLESTDEDGRNKKHMFNTINHEVGMGGPGMKGGSEHHNDSIMSKEETPYSAITTANNPMMSTFAHEQMLLSQGKLSKENAFKQRARSQFRGGVQQHQTQQPNLNLNEILSNHSLLQSNMSSSTMIDSSRPIKQKRSLNFYNKKREAERIDIENEKLMKRLESMQVSPHLDHKSIRRQMEEVQKYKKTIQGTSNRLIDVTPIIEKTRIRKGQGSQNRFGGPQYEQYRRGKHLPPLPDNYFGSQIDEVSSVRDSIIENESVLNIQHKEKSAAQRLTNERLRKVKAKHGICSTTEHSADKKTQRANQSISPASQKKSSQKKLQTAKTAPVSKTQSSPQKKQPSVVPKKALAAQAKNKPKSPMTDVQVEDIVSEHRAKQSPVKHQSSKLPQKLNQSPLSGNYSPKPNISIHEEPTDSPPQKQASYKAPSDSHYSAATATAAAAQEDPSTQQHILDQSTGEKPKYQPYAGTTAGPSDDYTIEADLDNDNRDIQTPAEEAQVVSSGLNSNQLGASSSAAEVVTPSVVKNAEFIGTKLNNDSDATSQPARASSFMANRDITASQESHEQQIFTKEAKAASSGRREVQEEDEDEDEDEEEDYQDDDYEEDNYEDDEDFASESHVDRSMSQIEKQSQSAIEKSSSYVDRSESQIEKTESQMGSYVDQTPEQKLTRETSQQETQKALQISGLLRKEDPQSASKVGSKIMQSSSTSKTLIQPVKPSAVKLAQESNSIQVAPSSSSFGVESQAAQSRVQKYPETIQEEQKHGPTMQSPITFAEQSSDMHKQINQNRDESASYEEDQDFVDGDDTTSKELQRPTYDVESITEQRFTPVTTHDNHNQPSQKNLRYVAMANSVGASSEALESAGRAMRPSAIDTILNDRKPLNDVAQSQPVANEDEDDDYEEDYNDDDDDSF